VRRALVLVLAFSLLAGALVAPAGAKKKKKKKKFVPVTFEASGSFALMNPADYNSGTSITRNEFQAVCGIPATQGLDGYVVELSEEISKVNAQVGVKGSDAGIGHDLDMYFYNAECTPTGAASTETADEIGVFPAGTKWVVVTAFVGLELEFDLAATEIQL
jgi:hypothetical protein